MPLLTCRPISRTPWNNGNIISQKAPLKLREIWALRIRLQMDNRLIALALFNLAIDSKLWTCDLVNLKVSDISDQLGSINRGQTGILGLYKSDHANEIAV